MEAKSSKNNPDVSFLKECFLGSIQESLPFPFPHIDAEQKEEIRLITDAIDQFAKKLDPVAIDKNAKVPKEIIDAMAEMGLFGLIIPKEYGGYGLNQTAYARVIQQMVRHDNSASITAIAHQSIGLKALLLFGNEQQKRTHLPDLASGKKIAAFALTEPGAGSDAYAISTKAEPTTDGKAYILNGQKIWITNGGIADFFTVFAKTKEADKEKITAFIVTRDMAGFSSGTEEHKMGIRGSSTTALTFDNVRVPVENIIGERGKGFKIAMTILNSGRLGLGAGCIGGIRNIVKLAADHAKQRKQFGKAIGEYGLVQEKIGRMMIDLFALESMVFLAAGMVDRGVTDYSLESACCKIFGSEALVRAANEALQIAGGAGFMQEYPYERLVRDARIMTIFEGTNEILRCFVALSGLQVVGEHLQLIGDALHDPIKSFGLLFSELVVKRTVGNAEITKAHMQLKREAAMIEDNVKRLNAAAEKAIMKYKRDIQTKQFIQKRLAEISIDLFGMVATVSRLTAVLNDQKSYDKKAVEAMLNLGQTFCAEAAQRIQYRVQNMNENNDEGIKTAARFAYEKDGYPFDIL